MKLSNQALGLLFAAIMAGLIVGTMFYRRFGGHEPIRPVPPATKVPSVPVVPNQS